MSDERIAALIEEGKALHEKTTQGEWQNDYSQTPCIYIEEADRNELIAERLYIEDAQFIVWAHENFKALVAAVKEREAEIERLTTLLKSQHDAELCGCGSDAAYCPMNGASVTEEISSPLPAPPAKEGE